MTRILLELVPRDKDQIDSQLSYVRNNYPEINAINIPDLIRFDIRSWIGATHARTYYADTIPHIRAIDFCLEHKVKVLDYIKEHEIKEILVVRGDLPHDMSWPTYPTSTIKFIKHVKKELPDVKVYAAIDQYRNNIKEEFNYIEEKIEAGADGFLTQPFFDMRLIEIFAEKVRGLDVYWGVSPVINKRSQNYWESKNMAYFPSDFDCSLKWNTDFARKVITFCKNNNFNLYLMPIRLNLEKYLGGIFREPSTN